jgi:hypothetical protein
MKACKEAGETISPPLVYSTSVLQLPRGVNMARFSINQLQEQGNYSS